MATYRIERVNKEFLRIISDLLQTKIKREDVKAAILTKVSASRDLSFAKVYYTLLETGDRESVQKALDSVAGMLRSLMGREMHLRTIPELHFVYDDSEIKARAMDELLDRLRAEIADKAPGVSAEGEEGENAL
jgi:ribosome-binding factor A